MPEQISVSEFVAETHEGYKAPKAFSFTTRTAQCRDTVAAIEEDAVTYDDVHVNFTGEEWNLLDPSQKSLYKDVMLETYWNLTVIGYTWENHHIERHCQSSRRNERSMRNKKSNSVNAMWKPFICYSSFNIYIMCHNR
ncbi:zinc finger protein 69 isoform X8 [Mus musculus]|nr:zinc finger protein 69 isoform X8 [Mus musculus]